MEQLMHDIEVECIPSDIPEKIVVNIDNLDIGQSIHIKDLAKIDGVKFMGQEDSVVVHVIHAKVVVAEEPVAEEAAVATEESKTEGE